MCWMKANRIDPSLAVGFKFSNYEEFESWTQVKSHSKLRVDSSVWYSLETIKTCGNCYIQKIKEEAHMPFGIVEASSDRLVSVRSTVISGDSDNSDYEVLDLNWCPSNADNHPMVVAILIQILQKSFCPFRSLFHILASPLFVKKIQDHMCFSPFIPLEYSKSYPSYHRNNKKTVVAIISNFSFPFLDLVTGSRLSGGGVK